MRLYERGRESRRKEKSEEKEGSMSKLIDDKERRSILRDGYRRRTLSISFSRSLAGRRVFDLIKADSKNLGVTPAQLVFDMLCTDYASYRKKLVKLGLERGGGE